MGAISVFASGHEAEIKNVPKTEGKEIVDVIRARLSAQAAPSAPPQAGHGQPAADPDAVFQQLRKLGELRAAGVVTPAEFEAKKAELLARI